MVASLFQNGLFYTITSFTLHITLLSFGNGWEGCQEENKKYISFYLLLEEITIIWIVGHPRKEKLKSCRTQASMV